MEVSLSSQSPACVFDGSPVLARPQEKRIAIAIGAGKDSIASVKMYELAKDGDIGARYGPDLVSSAICHGVHWGLVCHCVCSGQSPTSRRKQLLSWSMISACFCVRSSLGGADPGRCARCRIRKRSASMSLRNVLAGSS